MSKISDLRGYVNQPATKKGTKGEFSTFTLAAREKNRDGTYYKTYYNVTDFSSPTPPPESSYVTVAGRFKVREYTKKDGTKGQSLDVTADQIDIAPPLPAGGDQPTQPAATDNWDF